eukprot:scaffold11192_cov77-Phaeocystis_antarctica.AAC.4
MSRTAALVIFTETGQEASSLPSLSSSPYGTPPFEPLLTCLRGLVASFPLPSSLFQRCPYTATSAERLPWVEA